MLDESNLLEEDKKFIWITFCHEKTERYGILHETALCRNRKAMLPRNYASILPRIEYEYVLLKLTAYKANIFFSSSLSLKCALRESCCRIGYEPTKMSQHHFWRSISRDANVGVSALSPTPIFKMMNICDNQIIIYENFNCELCKYTLKLGAKFHSLRSERTILLVTDLKLSLYK